MRGKVIRPRPHRRPSAPYSEADVRGLLAACDRGARWISAHGQRIEFKRDTALRDRAIMLVLLDTGVRASELTALKS
jgi:integrase